jgi:hypothetical protein
MSVSDRLIDYDGTWLSGMKSDSDPGQLPIGYYWAGVNTLNLGGAISCRPGYRCLITFPKGNCRARQFSARRLGMSK